jgi:hypothetical protein
LITVFRTTPAGASLSKAAFLTSNWIVRDRTVAVKVNRGGKARGISMRYRKGFASKRLLVIASSVNRKI